jgi:hypothetical protein
MKKDSFLDYYLGNKLLLPKHWDLSFYNWNNGKCRSNKTEAFSVETKNRENVNLEVNNV